jgi:hypothetical protein
MESEGSLPCSQELSILHSVPQKLHLLEHLERYLIKWLSVSLVIPVLNISVLKEFELIMERLISKGLELQLSVLLLLLFEDCISQI